MRCLRQFVAVLCLFAWMAPQLVALQQATPRACCRKGGHACCNRYGKPTKAWKAPKSAACQCQAPAFFPVLSTALVKPANDGQAEPASLYRVLAPCEFPFALASFPRQSRAPPLV
ncbi:MAG: hypothetical protein NW208_17970 [Bryobacter sp.]|nr:hypothetical protein [Bryobacter sp.]